MNEHEQVKELQQRIDDALHVARTDGQIKGEEHKMWVIDDMVLALLGSQEVYDAWVADYESKPITGIQLLTDGEGMRKWEAGIEP
jgi:hypothetical protein